ncbi:MAG: hypothetical protein JO042_11765 [Sinobacteraceae bacterium]|nr:hypothetical protein [Nevskiaceae bacterium]
MTAPMTLLQDNGVQTGPQETVSGNVSFARVAAACGGYASSLETDDPIAALPRSCVAPIDVKTRLMQHFGFQPEGHNASTEA